MPPLCCNGAFSAPVSAHGRPLTSCKYYEKRVLHVLDPRPRGLIHARARDRPELPSRAGLAERFVSCQGEDGRDLQHIADMTGTLLDPLIPEALVEYVNGGAARLSGPLPKHVAIILDGNHRWAAAQGLALVMGHRQGAKSLRAVVERCAHMGIPALTVFAFSSENWNRDPAEVAMLLQTIETSLRNEVGELHANGVRLAFFGDIQRLPASLRGAIRRAEHLTKGNTGLHLAVALSYGGQQDLVQAVKKAAELVERQELKASDINEGVVRSLLQSRVVCAPFGPPDLLVRTAFAMFGRPVVGCKFQLESERASSPFYIILNVPLGSTSGEMRLSNFLLWDLAYTELYFSPKLWPEFTADDFAEAIAWYTHRRRRFGCRT